MVTYEEAISDSPYPSLRDVQKDGIKATIEAVDNDGFLVLEGACGTGKTLLSLLPLTSYVKDSSSKYNQVLVITSVKQQQEIFEEELRSINDTRREDDKDPITATTLVGKRDVCPYVKHDTIDADNIQSECESLREGTRDAIREEDDEEMAARRLKIRAQPDDTPVRRYDSDGTYEYPYDVDEYPEGSCPFYAGYQEARYNQMDDDGEYHPVDVMPFNPSEFGVMDVQDMISESGKAGMCPHSILGEAIQCTDVVIGNYTHVFDEKTRNFTEDLIRDDTLVVVDEAHNLVPRVRGILSNSITLKETYGKGIHELRELQALVSDSFGGEDDYWEDYQDLALDSTFLGSESDVKEAVELLSGLRGENFSEITTAKGQEAVCKAVTGSKVAALDTVVDAYESFYTDLYEKMLELSEDALNSGTAPIEEKLRDPQKLKPDKISQWLELKGDMQLMRSAEMFGKSMTALKSFLTTELYEDPTVDTNIQTLSEFWQKWADADYNRYFQSIDITERSYHPNNKFIEDEWQNEYRVSIKIQNCLPRQEIKDTVDSFGGGVFMSATLEPLDMYVKETGLSMFDERPIVERSYGLRFPEENRDTVMSPTTKFKYSKRGQNKDQKGDYNVSHPVRQEYKRVIEATVESTPGNILIVMPSYAEAWWAGEVVKNMNEIPRGNILVDEQSSLQETTDMKEEFFKGGKKVLVTGARGTLTEGVDYEGEKLKAAVVCGVPIANTNTLFNTAVEATYDDFFDNGFEFAFTLPAVRKARQAIGRVIRSEDEVGVRVFADERYCESENNWDSVHQYLPDSVKEEASDVSDRDIHDHMESFWESKE